MAFDLDDDELIATRRMNGSDKNVACVEENIEGLKRLFYANALTQYGKRKLIDYYEQLIKELEEENMQLEAIKDEAIRRYNFESIPVSLVEEKILEPMKEEHDKAIKGFIKRDIPQCIEDGGIAQELGYFIGKIEELLERRK